MAADAWGPPDRASAALGGAAALAASALAGAGHSRLPRPPRVLRRFPERRSASPDLPRARQVRKICKSLRHLQIGHHPGEVVHRVDAEFSRGGGDAHLPCDCGHLFPPMDFSLSWPGGMRSRIGLDRTPMWSISTAQTSPSLIHSGGLRKADARRRAGHDHVTGFQRHEYRADRNDPGLSATRDPPPNAQGQPSLRRTFGLWKGAGEGLALFPAPIVFQKLRMRFPACRNGRGRPHRTHDHSPAL